jgi:hypothetical protein
MQETFERLRQKVTLATWLLLLYIDILAKSGLYFNKIILRGFRKDIQRVFMFLNIVSSFVSIISVSLMNSRCLFGLWAKYAWHFYSKFLVILTIYSQGKQCFKYKNTPMNHAINPNGKRCIVCVYLLKDPSFNTLECIYPTSPKNKITFQLQQ